MNINIMTKYSNWKGKMNAQVLRKYKMSDAIVAKLPIQIIKMQNTAIFVL
jgi:hypothetical protein